MKTWARSFVAFAFAFGLVALAMAPAPASAQLFSRPAAAKGRATVEVLDVGQGDSILIRSPEGKVALIDAGPSHDVVNLLKQRGVTSIDLVALTHHHADHYGGMAEVVREFKPKYFLVCNSTHSTPTYLKLLKVVKEHNVQVVQPTKAPRKVELGSVDLTIFPQPPLNEKEENDNSIGIRLQYGAFSMLLTGDSEEEERRWWEQHNPDLLRHCTVLKLAHHGSRNGTDARWLELVKPKLAIASLGKNNDYHHPHPETVSLLSRTGVPFLRTDQAGTVTIHFDGKTWQAESVHGRAAHGRTVAASDDEYVELAKTTVERKDRRAAIDLNTATEEELRAIPGIGPVIAREIIEGRPYESVDDLHRVRGIGKARLAEIRDAVVVR